MARSLRNVLRTGLAEIRPYLLSHHHREDWDRCYLVRWGRGQIAVCARCLGIYPGIAVGIGVSLHVQIDGQILVALVAFLPASALTDWALTTFTRYRGRNPVRTATGLGLGVAYGLGAVAVTATQTLALLTIALTYGGIALALLTLERKTS